MRKEKYLGLNLFVGNHKGSITSQGIAWAVVFEKQNILSLLPDFWEHPKSNNGYQVHNNYLIDDTQDHRIIFGWFETDNILAAKRLSESYTSKTAIFCAVSNTGKILLIGSSMEVSAKMLKDAEKIAPRAMDWLREKIKTEK